MHLQDAFPLHAAIIGQLGGSLHAVCEGRPTVFKPGRRLAWLGRLHYLEKIT